MRKSVYEMVTDRIIAELENGQIPWNRPWTGTKSGAYNRISKKPYSLLNQMMLKHSGEYASFKQWTDLSGKIRKGEKSEIVVFRKWQEVEEAKEAGTIEKRSIPFLRYYNVFHINQVDSVEPLKPEELHDTEPLAEPEELFSNYLKRENIKLEQTASNEAYYSPSRDIIHLPLLEQFGRIEEYYNQYTVPDTGADLTV